MSHPVTRFRRQPATTRHSTAKSQNQIKHQQLPKTPGGHSTFAAAAGHRVILCRHIQSLTCRVEQQLPQNLPGDWHHSTANMDIIHMFRPACSADSSTSIIVWEWWVGKKKEMRQKETAWLPEQGNEEGIAWESAELLACCNLLAQILPKVQTYSSDGGELMTTTNYRHCITTNAGFQDSKDFNRTLQQLTTVILYIAKDYLVCWENTIFKLS